MVLLYSVYKYYFRNFSGRLQNVDISYKWAGGGLVSSAPDLCRLGSSLLLCYQSRPNSSSPSLRKIVEQHKASKVTGKDFASESCVMEPPLLLQPETVSAMWREVVHNIYFSSNPRLSYGLGWIVRKEGERVQGGKREPFCVGHTGAAVGASSVLLILPNKLSGTGEKEVEGNVNSENVKCEKVMVGGNEERNDGRVPSGVVVAIMFNLQEVQGMFSLGSKIAALFCHLA